MNERLRLLAHQAWVDNDNMDVGGYTDLEKFAELIVRECANVAKLTEADYGNDYKSGRTWAGIDILEHFGVEE